jgi:hypothetical protein
MWLPLGLYLYVTRALLRLSGAIGPFSNAWYLVPLAITAGAGVVLARGFRETRSLRCDPLGFSLLLDGRTRHILWPEIRSAALRLTRGIPRLDLYTADRHITIVLAQYRDIDRIIAAVTRGIGPDRFDTLLRTGDGDLTLDSLTSA